MHVFFLRAKGEREREVGRARRWQIFAQRGSNSRSRLVVTRNKKKEKRIFILLALFIGGVTDEKKKKKERNVPALMPYSLTFADGLSFFFPPSLSLSLCFSRCSQSVGDVATRFLVPRMAVNLYETPADVDDSTISA